MRLFLATTILTTILGLGLIFTAHAAEPDQAVVPLAAAIGEATARLNLPPRTTELISEKALRTRQAITQGDFTLAHHIIVADVLQSSQIQNWRYYPFADFVTMIADVGDPAFATRLDEWVGQNSGDPIPVLICAEYYCDLGWFKRGTNFVKYTQPGHMAAFADDIAKALTDVDTAITLDDGNPYAFYLKLRILRGRGATQNLKSAFEQAIAGQVSGLLSALRSSF